MTVCEEILIRLRNIEQVLNPLTLLGSIDASLKKLLNSQEVIITTLNEWYHIIDGKIHIYRTTITLAGATQTLTLPFTGYAHQINHIFMYFNSANARTFNIKEYGFSSPTHYVTLDSQVGHTSDSRIIQLGIEYKTRIQKLEWNFSAYTVGDMISVEVQVDML